MTERICSPSIPMSSLTKINIMTMGIQRRNQIRKRLLLILIVVSVFGMVHWWNKSNKFSGISNSNHNKNYYNNSIHWKSNIPDVSMNQRNDTPTVFNNDETTSMNITTSSGDTISTTTQLQLVFHVGPGKMGSSTIQSVLESSKETLEIDGWVSYPHIKLTTLNRCIVRNNNSCPLEMERFQTFVHHAENKQQNIVLSTERWFSQSMELEWYQQLFQTTSYHVTIIIAYRRYYNWLPSRYFQLYRFRCKPNPSEKKTKKKNNLNYTDNLQQQIPPLHAYISNTRFDHPSIHKRRRVSHFFDDIYVMDVETIDLIQHFFCIVLKVSQTCHSIQSIPPKSTNQGKSLLFDRLAQYLLLLHSKQQQQQQLLLNPPNQSHGLDWRKKMDCGSLATMIEQFNDPKKSNPTSTRKKKKRKNLITDFPYICPSSQQMDALFHVSYEAERILFPNQFQNYNNSNNNNSSNDPSKLNHNIMWDDFVTKQNTTAFCDVDLEAVLLDETWQELLDEVFLFST